MPFELSTEPVLSELEQLILKTPTKNKLKMIDELSLK